eukprot:6006109-Pyramimonas_sp.AAC.1
MHSTPQRPFPFSHRLVQFPLGMLTWYTRAAPTQGGCGSVASGAPGVALRPRLVCLWVPLVPATIDNGCMWYLPREMDRHW